MRDRWSAWARRAWPFALFAACLAALLPEVVFRGLSFVGDNDRVVLEMPDLSLAAQALRGRYWPFWDSLSFCGHFLFGQANLRLLYPLNLLLVALLPGHLFAAASWRILLELFLALCAYYGLFLAVWRDRATAAFCAVAYGLSMSMVLFVNEGHIPPFFPALALWVVLTRQDRPLRRNLIYLSGALYLQISGGYPQYTAYFLILALLCSLAWTRPSADGRRDWLELGALWAGAFGLAAAMNLPELVPFLKAQSASNRLAMDYGTIYRNWTQPPFMALRLALPHFLGGTAQFPRLPAQTAIANAYESFPVYAGVPCLLFALVGARRARSRRDAAAWLSAAAAVAALSLRTPLASLPYLAFGRSPLIHGRMANLLPLIEAFLAGIGLQEFCAGDRRFKASCLAQSAVVSALVTAGACGWLGPLSIPRLLPADVHAAAPQLEGWCRAAGAAFGVCAALVLLVMAAATAGLRAEAVKGLSLLVLAGDLLFSARSGTLLKVFRPGDAWYPPSPLTDYLRALPGRADARFDVAPGVLWADVATSPSFNPNINALYGIANVNGYANFLDRRYAAVATRGQSVLRGFASNDVVSYGQANLLGVSYFVVPDSPDSRALYGAFADPLARSANALVLRMRQPAGQFHLACSTVKAPDSWPAVAQIMDSPGFDGRTQAVVESSDGFSSDWSRCLPGRESLDLHEARPGLIAGAVSAERPRLLVVSQNFDPGWRARLNGAPARLHRVNHAFLGLELPAGRSEIELRYRAPYWAASLLCALAAWLALIAIAAAPMASASRIPTALAQIARRIQTGS